MLKKEDKKLPKKEKDDIEHVACPNWPNCDISGCGTEFYGNRD